MRHVHGQQARACGVQDGFVARPICQGVRSRACCSDPLHRRILQVMTLSCPQEDRSISTT